MAASATPSGAKCLGTLSASGSFTGKVQHLKIASGYDTLISWGDFVKLVAAGTIEKDAGTTTATPVGVFMGCSYTDPNTSQPTYAQMWTADVAASDALAYVITDPNVLFQMQGDGAITQAMLGSNFAVVVTAGSTTIGRSKNAVDQSTSATTATLPLRIVDYVYGPDSAVGDAYTDVIMKFNDGHQYVNTTGI